jgi:hypothetical protein
MLAGEGIVVQVAILSWHLLPCRACSAAVRSPYGPVTHYQRPILRQIMLFAVPVNQKCHRRKPYKSILSSPARHRVCDETKTGVETAWHVLSNDRIGDRKWSCICSGVMRQLRVGLRLCCCSPQTGCLTSRDANPVDYISIGFLWLTAALDCAGHLRITFCHIRRIPSGIFTKMHAQSQLSFFWVCSAPFVNGSHLPIACSPAPHL